MFDGAILLLCVVVRWRTYLFSRLVFEKGYCDCRGCCCRLCLYFERELVYVFVVFFCSYVWRIVTFIALMLCECSCVCAGASCTCSWLCYCYCYGALCLFVCVFGVPMLVLVVRVDWLLCVYPGSCAFADASVCVYVCSRACACS